MKTLMEGFHTVGSQLQIEVPQPFSPTMLFFYLLELLLNMLFLLLICPLPLVTALVFDILNALCAVSQGTNLSLCHFYQTSLCACPAQTKGSLWLHHMLTPGKLSIHHLDSLPQCHCCLTFP